MKSVGDPMSARNASVTLIAAVLIACPAAARAQDAVPIHPALEDRFYFAIGAYFPRTTTEAQLTTRLGVGASVDFEKTLGMQESKPVLNVMGRWRLSERWRVEAE